ncbi:TIMELESS-interacting protein [Sarotherodon galilaeus]
MLLKAKLGGVQKFVRVFEPSLNEFLIAAFAKFGVPAVTEGVKVFDSSGTELDDDVFEDIVTDPSTRVLTIKYERGLETCAAEVSLEWSQLSSSHSSDSQDTLVESILTSKPGGERIINEYNQTKSLVDETRRQMVNILVAFKSCQNEHYYDVEGGTGYLAWRIKTIQRCTAKERRLTSGDNIYNSVEIHNIVPNCGDGSSSEDQCGGPTVRRELQFVTEKVLSEDECKDTISLMKHSADEDTLKKKMKLTFVYRHNMVLDPLLSSNILSVFPRFKDIKGLIKQDFILMFGEDVSFRLLERWPTTFKRKIIQQGRKLPSTSDLELLLAADSPEDATEVNADIAILLLLHLIPPSASQAERHLVVFKKTGTNIQEHLDAITTSTQPYLLAVGVKKNDIHQFLIMLDKNAMQVYLFTCFVSSMEEVFFEIHTQAKDPALQSVPSQDTTSKNKYNSNKIKH